MRFSEPYREGIRWMKAAAQNSNEYAAYVLGKEYLRGKDVINNSNIATGISTRRLNRITLASYLLRKLYLMDEGVEHDEDTAYEWFQAAAEQGHTYAQFFADRIEQRGQNVSPSLLLPALRLFHHVGNIFREKAPTIQPRVAFTLIASGSKNSGQRKWLWGTSRMTMRRSRLWAA